MTTELTKAAQQAPAVTLYECVGCGHLYQNTVSQCDCLENHDNEYHEWIAQPKSTIRNALTVYSDTTQGVVNDNSAAQTEREADGLPPIVAGAIFDFAGFMTTRSEVIEVGSTAEAGPVADLVKEWAELRGLDLTDAAVLSWQLHINRASLLSTQQATPATPEDMKVYGGIAAAYFADTQQATPEPEFDDCPESPTGKHSESWFGNGDCEHCKTGAQNAPMAATPEPLIVKGAMAGMVDAQVRDLWPTKGATPEPVGEPALTRYKSLNIEGEESCLVERLRGFLSIALSGQDWLDVEPFLDALTRPAPGVSEDSELLDYLDTLAARPAGSDLHCFGGRVVLYVRTGIGSQIEASGAGTAREAIRAALAAAQAKGAGHE